MAQTGFVDVENRYAALEAKNDPLAKMNAAAAREAFHSRLAEDVVRSAYEGSATE